MRNPGQVGHTAIQHETAVHKGQTVVIKLSDLRNTSHVNNQTITDNDNKTKHNYNKNNTM